MNFRFLGGIHCILYVHIFMWHVQTGNKSWSDHLVWLQVSSALQQQTALKIQLHTHKCLLDTNFMKADGREHGPQSYLTLQHSGCSAKYMV